jgi:hypothetical protein
MQGVGHADVLLYFKCLADAVPCERSPNYEFKWAKFNLIVSSAR